MASIQPKNFEVDLFFSGSSGESDRHQDVFALTELSAAQRAMEAAGVEQAQGIRVVAPSGQVFGFYDVRLVNGRLLYGSFVRPRSAKLIV